MATLVRRKSNTRFYLAILIASLGWITTTFGPIILADRWLAPPAYFAKLLTLVFDAGMFLVLGFFGFWFWIWIASQFE